MPNIRVLQERQLPACRLVRLDKRRKETLLPPLSIFMKTQITHSSTSQFARRAILLAAVASILVWFYVFDPSKVDAFLPCPFYAATGWSCPGCGTQRAMHLFLHGEFLAALRSNFLALVLVPVVAYQFFSHFSGAACGRLMPELQMRNSVVWFTAAIIVAYWIVRNLSWWRWPVS